MRTGLGKIACAIFTIVNLQTHSRKITNLFRSIICLCTDSRLKPVSRLHNFTSYKLSVYDFPLFFEQSIYSLAHLIVLVRTKMTYFDVIWQPKGSENELATSK